MRAFALLALLATPVGAGEELSDIYGSLLFQCYAEADGLDAKSQCAGATSTACMEQEDGGYSTLGMSMCTHAETVVWDNLLNAEYRETIAFMKALDQEDMEIFPDYANREKALRQAQRAWIAYRDAECELDYALWGAGSMRHIAGSACMSDLTAKRTIELRSKREVMQ